MRTNKKVLQDLYQEYIQYKNILNQREIPDRYERLDVKQKKGKIEFTCYERDLKTGRRMKKYLPKTEWNHAGEIAEGQYLIKLKKLVDKRIRQLRYLLKDYENNELDAVYENFHPAKKALFNPVLPTKVQKARAWKKKPYLGKELDADAMVITTNKGEMVRSKSEKILADLFLEMGVEYKYECPLKLGKNYLIHPDFTFLNPINLEEIYWEHNGMMDNPTYAVNAYKRIRLYEGHGIYRGERLIVTYESSSDNLDYKWARKLIQKFLLPPQ